MSHVLDTNTPFAEGKAKSALFYRTRHALISIQIHAIQQWLRVSIQIHAADSIEQGTLISIQIHAIQQWLRVSIRMYAIYE